jgi:hypothetical protein
MTALRNENLTASKKLSLIIAIALAMIASACANDGTGSSPNTNTTASAPANSNANTNSAAGATPLEAREPLNYSVRTTVNVLPTGKSPQANIPPLQFNFARMGSDRRVSFKLPDPVGEVIYIEKASTTVKYLVFPARNQYVELDAQELGFPLGEVMSPVTVIERLKERAQYEQLGTETVNGRTAIKYHFKGSADTRTRAGTAQADSIVYVDQETGLPLKSEVDTTSTSGAGAKIVTTTDALQFTVEPTLFEVPPGMKKVTSTEVKQQVQSFVNGVRVIADYIRQQARPAQQP